MAHISQTDQLELARQLLAAQRWWEQAGLSIDLVVIVMAQKDDANTLAGPVQALQKELKGETPKTPGSGEFFVLPDSDLSDIERDGLAATARIVLDGRCGNLAAQLQRAESSPMRPQDIRQSACSVQSAIAEMHADKADDEPDATHELEFFNGLGGFSANGHEYVIELPAHQSTPLPWINVIANPGFGFLVSAEGGGYSWAVNSQTNSLTPWSNDPVLDPPGDVLYVRDNDDGALWSATPSPVRTGARFEVRHGHGYTRFRQQVHAIASDLLQFVPGDDPVKISRLRLQNASNETRHLQITAYVQWALAANGELAAPHIVTARDNDSGALTARNDWRPDYVGRVAFADLCGLQTRWICDRREFLGTWGNLNQPAALMRDTRLSGTCGAGIEPCAALQAEVVLHPGETTEIVFVLGEAADDRQMRKLVARYRAADPEQLLDDVCRRWRGVTDTVQVKTPDRRLDLLVNGWLPYQIISCRLHARTAFYQASGAWGFRDQLQDVAALPLSAPQLVREHLLRAAGRQFLEGDVQHWWLPPTGAGSRTHKVDDRLWLPLATAHYVNTTDDTSVLDEPVAFLEGKAFPTDQADDFYLPGTSPEHASLFEHCARAIEASFVTGPHGLPLFGTGDWNDGMNLVGCRGRGESVWMAWFLLATIHDFAPLADARGAHDRAAKWRQHAVALADAAHAHAWDGHWWLRGWYDDGTPLGSHASRECRIDGIAQSWSVISGGTSNDRGQQAMEAVDRILVRRDARVVALLAPPFDTASQEPGYIKGYPSGLRENGGQYTHGSVWAAIAFAMLGDGDRAWELFDMLEPISHADTPEAVARWKVEPYVACADVYTAPQHLGRGGWTWYTGSAGWLYRTAVEWLLGIHVQGATLRIDPCIPHTWPGFSVELRWHSALYRIQVDNPSQVCRNLALLSVDGIRHDPQCAVALCDDHATHQINAALG